MRCHWIALPLLLLCTAFVLGNPPKENPPNKKNPPKPPPKPHMPAWNPNWNPNWMPDWNAIARHWNGNGNGHMPKLITAHLDYQLDPTGDMIVRLMYPPLQYDDKGFPKKYTADELKALKGDNPKLIGYNGDTNDLKTGLQVKVYVVKDPPPAKENPKADKPDNANKPDKPDKPKYIAVGDLTGQLTVAGNSDKGMTLRVSYQTWEGGGWRPPANGNQKDAPRLQVGMIVVLSPPQQDAPAK
jgi:hypothetical protein